ncbi:YdcF family protein [Nisaea sp.]|uniref:YdcF family protein n=1 Tax=Nisaea sp. TaxID=2024842 RepID=UPI003B52656C
MDRSRGFLTSTLRGWLLRAAIGALALLLFWIGGFLWFLAAMPAEAPDATPEADAIVVLTGGSRRVPVAVSLLLEGRARALLVTGVNDIVGPPAFRAAMAESGLTVDPQLMACCIALGYGAHDTIGNAAEAAAWMKAGGYGSMILVTSTYHMARSAMEFHAAMPGVEIHEHPVRPASPGLEDWWTSPDSRLLMFSEFVKFQAAWLRVTIRALIPG